MSFDDRIDDLFIDLPEPPSVVGAYVNVVRTGKLLYISGVLPKSEGKMMTGRVGIDVRLDTGCQSAKAAALLALSIIKNELGGSLNKVKRIIQLSVAVASGADFKDHFKVLNSASDLLVQIFGPSGKHTRIATGATSLPENASVELSMIVEVR